MAGEATIINVAARTSLWLQPHRIVLILIAIGAGSGRRLLHALGLAAAIL